MSMSIWKSSSCYEWSNAVNGDLLSQLEKILWFTIKLSQNNIFELRNIILYYRKEIEEYYKKLWVWLNKTKQALLDWLQKWDLREEEAFVEDVMYNLKISIGDCITDSYVEKYKQKVEKIVYLDFERKLLDILPKEIIMSDVFSLIINALIKYPLEIQEKAIVILRTYWVLEILSTFILRKNWAQKSSMFNKSNLIEYFYKLHLLVDDSNKLKLSIKKMWIDIFHWFEGIEDLAKRINNSTTEELENYFKFIELIKKYPIEVQKKAIFIFWKDWISKVHNIFENRTLIENYYELYKNVDDSKKMTFIIDNMSVTEFIIFIFNISERVKEQAWYINNFNLRELWLYLWSIKKSWEWELNKDESREKMILELKIKEISKIEWISKVQRFFNDESFINNLYELNRIVNDSDRLSILINQMQPIEFNSFVFNVCMNREKIARYVNLYEFKNVNENNELEIINNDYVNSVRKYIYRLEFEKEIEIEIESKKNIVTEDSIKQIQVKKESRMGKWMKKIWPFGNKKK